MPTYQYSCTECGHFFEQFQSFSEESLTVCPQCEGRLRKVFNAVGVVFKGSGFYRTDSRSGAGEKATAGSDGGGAAAVEKGSTPKTPASTSSEGGGSASGSKAPAPSGSSSGSSGSSTSAA